MDRLFIRKSAYLILAFTCAFLLVSGLLSTFRASDRNANAAPIPPPEGYPKLRYSAMTVDPTLANTGGATLAYRIEIRNTGASPAESTAFSNPIPANTSYNFDAQASAGPAPSFSNGSLQWVGDVGFDSTVVISYSVNVASAFSGVIQNSATINQALLNNPITVTAEATISDDPVLVVEKSAAPDLPGASKPLTYTLRVTNQGQPASNLAITVTDQVPANTTYRSVGPDGVVSPAQDVVTWTRNVSLGHGESTDFSFSVNVGSVPSGTILTNQVYQVSGAGGLFGAGVPLTSTVVDPILSLSKQVSPFPPGSNREMTYTLTLLNKGSAATDLVIRDQVPSGVTYLRGGTYANGEVTWTLPSLETGESAEFSFTVYVGDVANVPILNNFYQACSAEGVCQEGRPTSSLVLGPAFQASASLDPIAKKPGGGNAPVTPTLTVHNLGPGNAIDATALLKFGRISVGEANDLVTIPARGSFSTGPECGDKCVAYLWVGSIGAEETITFTTSEGQNTIGGEEGTLYTATVIITDSLTTGVTNPISATATGKVTHLGNLIPSKSAPPVTGRGLPMTYTITVWNSGQTTDAPPFPELTDVVPLSTTLLNISDGGSSSQVNGRTVVSWILPALSTGESLVRTFAVLVDDDLISGTQIINQDYWSTWYDIEVSSVLSNTGEPVTTTVKEVGLVDSYKEVTPTVALPGPGIVLTHQLHIVNTGPLQLNNVSLKDDFPWEHSTYQRDAIASAGQVISDIVSLNWNGNLAPFSSEIVTFTVVVDEDYQGAITNTASIDHSSLLEPLQIQSVAYITDLPVLHISKSATPDPVRVGNPLSYEIHVRNLGQQATDLTLTDEIPANTSYVAGSASDGGQLVGSELEWQFVLLAPGEERTFNFMVTAEAGNSITNQNYQINSAEGIFAIGDPVVTLVTRDGRAFMPLIYK